MPRFETIRNNQPAASTSRHTGLAVTSRPPINHLLIMRADDSSTLVRSRACAHPARLGVGARRLEHDGELGPAMETAANEKTDIELNGMLTALHAYWRSKRGGRTMPMRQDIRPEEIGALLPIVSLLEAVDGRLRFRLAGNRIEAAYGSDLRGKFLDEIQPAQQYKIAARSYAMALGCGRPVISRSNYRTPTGQHLLITRLLLPLTADGIRASMILAGVDLNRRNKALYIGPSTIADPDEADIQLL